MQAEIIQQLKAERATLEKIRLAATEQIESAVSGMARIDRAIEALNGDATPKKSGVTCAAMVEEIILALPLDAVFDAMAIRRKAFELFPSSREKLRTGVYGAVMKQLKQGKIKRVMGGFQRA